jgi:hypothetical protein
MILSQNSSCAICEIPFRRNVQRGTGVAHVDHCHSTKIVRGILCHACNTGIGVFKDNEKLLQRAIEYLRGVKLCGW